jgi:hypothetical protein
MAAISNQAAAPAWFSLAPSEALLRFFSWPHTAVAVAPLTSVA